MANGWWVETLMLVNGDGNWNCTVRKLVDGIADDSLKLFVPPADHTFDAMSRTFSAVTTSALLSCELRLFQERSFVVRDHHAGQTWYVVG